MTHAVRPIKLTVAALGGQGGGVVSDWLIDVARREGYLAQATSVPGVAQRTGATIYYLEFFPISALPADGRKPVLALMPHPGDVDIVVASELMEAGRALQRGIVTPDRTTLIASSHRVYAIGEKMHMADGRADAQRVEELVRQSCKRYISFDMQAMAEATGSVISAVMLGALAGSRALPFATENFREAIRASGIAVKQSLAAFDAAANAASTTEASDNARSAAISQSSTAAPAGSAPTDAAPGRASTGTSARSIPPSLAERIERQFPSAVRGIVREGTRRLIDYQDLAYASLYLDRLAALTSLERDAGSSAKLIETVARGLALWMSFEDTIRVADLKIRDTRHRRVLAEVRAKPGELVYVTEFMKPRVEEILGTLPAGLGGRMLASPFWRGLLGRFTSGRQISTSRVGGFFLLYCLAGIRRWRRGTLRYAEEDRHILNWLSLIQETAPRNYELAIEIAECQALVKGYGETHQRGARNFDLITANARRWVGRPDAAAKVRELRTAALSDDQGIALAQALRQVA
jgi:indolepyruvate ferredoxin oxidoreductase beta subunit